MTINTKPTVAKRQRFFTQAYGMRSTNGMTRRPKA